MSDNKRWYDYDPSMLQLINILKDYQDELREQAVEFLNSIESKVSKDAIDKYYNMVKPINGGNRWYDKDPVISRTVELLRIIPQETQRQTAQLFIETLKKAGIDIKE